MRKQIRKLVVVEDDPEDEAFIVEGLRSHFGVDPEVIRTESEFASALDRMAANPPDIVVLDIMLRWAFPSPELRADDAPGTFHLAGIRCLDLLLANESTQSIPVVLYTALDQEDFKNHAIVTKSDHIGSLIRAIEDKLVGGTPEQSRR